VSTMGSAAICFTISLFIFLIGLALILPALGYPGITISTSNTTSNTEVVTITRNGETITATIPKGYKENLRLYERLNIMSAYVEKATSQYYEIAIEVKNKGSIDTAIDDVYVNNKKLEEIPHAKCSPQLPIQVKVNQSIKLILSLPKTQFKPGQVIQIIIHTSNKEQYPTQVTLP